MPEVIDIITQTQDKCPFFVVNNAVDFVTPTNPAVPNDKLYNASSKDVFQNGDSFSLLSAGIILPEAFTFWKDPAALALALPVISLFCFGATTGLGYTIDSLGKKQTFFIPMENYEIALDVFVDSRKQTQILAPTVTLNENFSLKSALANVKISMQNIPAALNGKTFILVPFFKILHNFPLT